MNKLKFITVAIIVMFLVLGYLRIQANQDPKIEMLKTEIKSTDPPCLQMYFYIEKYSEEFDIPKSFAYGIAFYETRYEGPFHWKYDPARTSSVGALGPMQIMPATSRLINKETVSTEKLKTDIAYNIRTSMKLLRRLYDKYQDWKIVFGAYNTGRPMINGYAINVYNYKPNW
jgi:soluble lytic murein transglycosylase-like protein